jgi:DNA-binding NarL/FixJ family response regulator
MPAVVALVDDLMFLSRIREAAKGHGLEVRTVRTVADLAEACRQDARLVLIDLDRPRLPLADALAALAAPEAAAVPPVVGFFSHVHAERGRQARAAGVAEALPRSAFVERLPDLLAQAAAPRSPEPRTG